MYCRGDFFEIRQVIERKTRRVRCAKIYRKEEIKAKGKYSEETTGRDLVERELKLLSRLDHPNILKV
jgi:hypothetical protein